MPRAARVGALVLAWSLAPRWASAHADGRVVNRATVGCGALGNCHGVNAGATATLTGPMTVQAGSRSTYVLTLRSTYPGFVGGGFDVGALGPAGTSLAVNAAQANTRINGADLVMNSRFAAVGGAVTVTFDLVTPTAGAATINAVGNATNGVGSAGGRLGARLARGRGDAFDYARRGRSGRRPAAARRRGRRRCAR